MRDVACPVIRRGQDVLVFRHPIAGVQLVKGGIGSGENPTAAAIRELQEEAGIIATAIGPPTASTEITPLEQWWFVPLTAKNLPNDWDHSCHDDGGHVFSFFWHPIQQALSDSHPKFERARRLITTLR